MEGEVPRLTVGVLVFQGSFAEHLAKLDLLSRLVADKVQVKVLAVKEPESLQGLSGLIIPGGESTTMGLFLRKKGFDEALKQWIKEKAGVVWGTCAGLILLANRVEGQKEGGQPLVGGVGITASRNLYGRQTSSFEAKVNIQDPGLLARPALTIPPCDRENCCCGSSHDCHVTPADTCHGVFIRAPGIKSVDDPSVRILATIGDNVVGVHHGNLLVTSFHPELTCDLRWHLYFLQCAVGSAGSSVSLLPPSPPA